MKKIIKNICAFAVIITVLLSTVIINISALTGTTSIILSNKNPKVGSTLTVTVKYNLDENAAVGGILSFDNTVLKHISHSPEGDMNLIDGNKVKIVADAQLKTHAFKIDFEVIAESVTIISLGDCKASSTVEVEVSGASVRVTTGAASSNTSSTTQQDTNSNTKAALSSIKVAAGTLTPAFKENITEYTVVVPYTQTDGLLTCEALDKKAKVSVEGDRELKVGLNKRTIVVVASNGETRRYNVTFNRLDENGNDITAAQDDSNSVLIDNKEFVIAQNDSSIVIPKGFSLTTATYEEKEIAVYSDATGKITIVYLTAKDESEEGFYLLNNGKFTKFYYIECAEVCYVIKEDNGTAPEGFYKSTYEHNGVNIPCFKYTSQDYADFIVVSAVTTSGGEGYYRYDVKENTMQRYSEFTGGIFDGTKEETSVVTAPVRLTAVVLCVIFALGVIALIVLIIIKICSRKKVTDEIVEEGYTIEMNSDTPEDNENE